MNSMLRLTHIFKISITGYFLFPVMLWSFPANRDSVYVDEYGRNWITYTDSKSHLSFKYPKNFEIRKQKDVEVEIPIVGSVLLIGYTMHDPQDSSHSEFVDFMSIYFSNQRFEEIAENEGFQAGFDGSIFMNDSLRDTLKPSAFDWILEGRNRAQANIIIWDDWKGMMGEADCGVSFGNGEFTTAAEFTKGFVFRYRHDGIKIVASYYSGPLPFEEEHYHPEMDLSSDDYRKIVESIRMSDEDFE